MRDSDERRSARVTPPGLLRGYVDSHLEAKILNLSPAGALIEHANRLSPGGTCALTLRLLGADLRLRAHIVWSRAKEERGEEVRYRSGVRFSDLPAAVEATLRQYLATVRVPKKADLMQWGE